MTQETLDCRGLTCPQPVVETKKKLTEMKQGTLTVLVDNETAKNNLLKLASALRFESASREEDGLYAVTLLKEEKGPAENAQARRKLMLVSGETLGRGSDELGAILMKSFFYALSESDNIPESIYLINAGVKLACTGSAVLESLQKLAQMGSQVYSCGLCLDFLELKSQLAVGEVTNMYAIVDALTMADTVIL
ncbi:MAG: sulfurtransferase-like selenium metabolism protein YedF [Bacillota bacterium]|nr:sulfurtransferase-like selenium metabolism protein YedF [Bacillota bacterium]MDW7682491.1 sulfurtransferase-like selenium metabolism protein YedF [Bacillota bacterium]